MPRSCPPSFDFYPDDFVTGTMHLHPFCICIYVRLLCFQWSHGYIPDSQRELIQVTGCTADELTQYLPAVLEKFVRCDDGKMRNKRLDQEKEKKMSIRNKRSSAANQSWVNRSSDANASANASANNDAKNMQREDGSRKMEDGSKKRKKGVRGKKEKTESIPRPEEVDEQVWADWLIARANKEAGPVTKTVLARIRSQAEKAKLTLSEAIAIAAARGWAGFESDWLESSNGNGKAEFIGKGQRDFEALFGKGKT